MILVGNVQLNEPNFDVLVNFANQSIEVDRLH